MSEENIFNIDPNVKESTPSKFVLIEKEDDFVQDNVYIKSLELDPEENRYFQVTAERNGQQMQTQRQYFPDKSSARNEETFKKASQIKRGLLANILRKFKGEDAAVQADNWVDMVRKIDEACKPHYSSTPLRVKLELVENQGKFYSNISTFSPFENMSVPSNQSKLRVTAKDKQMLRNKLEEEKVKPDSDSSSNSSKDDNPF